MAYIVILNAFQIFVPFLIGLELMAGEEAISVAFLPEELIPSTLNARPIFHFEANYAV